MREKLERKELQKKEWKHSRKMEKKNWNALVKIRKDTEIKGRNRRKRGIMREIGGGSNCDNY